MAITRDKIWLWAHEAGSHNSWANMPGVSRITPVEAACHMGISNLILVAYANRPEPPFDQYALPMSGLRRLV